MLETIHLVLTILASIITLLGLIIANEPCRYIGLTCLLVCNVIGLYRSSRNKKKE